MIVIPTNQCPALPPHMNPKTTPKPVPDLKNDEVDTWLDTMMPFLHYKATVPTTQYGRRVAVAMFLRR